MSLNHFNVLLANRCYVIVHPGKYLVMKYNSGFIYKQEYIQYVMLLYKLW